MEKKRLIFELLGDEYRILVNSPEEEAHMQKAVELLERQVNSTLPLPNMTRQKAMVYASMNLADLYLKAEKTNENLRKQISDSADQISKLEKEITKQKAEKPKRTRSQSKEAKEAKERKEAEERKDAQETSLPEPEENTTPDMTLQPGTVRDAKDLMEELQQELAQETLLPQD